MRHAAANTQRRLPLKSVAMLDRLDQYNVVWDSPSTGINGSMPLGNGDIGVNIWAEAGGDVLLLIGKTLTNYERTLVLATRH